MAIHSTAIVDPGARISSSADIGPYCVIGAEVDIASGTRLVAHVYVEGPTWIGSGNILYPYSSIGAAPQDLKYAGERSETRIGDANIIREFVTIHRGTTAGGLLTSIGNQSLLSAYTHVAHDCNVGNHVVLSHAATLGGHVTVEDWAVVGAGSAIHQFCRVGKHSMIGGYSVITQDILPYSMTVTERDPRVFGANRVGLERRGFSNESIEALQKAFRLLTRSGLNTRQAIERIQAEVTSVPELDDLMGFIATSDRGFIK
jgi:UDP-N-acetylglucosamine acyltransferase